MLHVENTIIIIIIIIIIITLISKVKENMSCPT